MFSDRLESSDDIINLPNLISKPINSPKNNREYTGEVIYEETEEKEKEIENTDAILELSS
jgi:hypothetical protein